MFIDNIKIMGINGDELIQKVKSELATLFSIVHMHHEIFFHRLKYL